MDEHVGLAVRVPGHEVGGVREEGDEAAVGAERGIEAGAVPPSKATKRPSALIAGAPLEAFAAFPALSTLTRSVVPADARAGVARRARAPARTPTAATLATRVRDHVTAAVIRLFNERLSVATNQASRLMTFCPHWVISNASTTTYAPL
ncbi:MAG: hypothetical protein E6J77_10175, partial [Deltaproteobacteria bacterium]